MKPKTIVYKVPDYYSEELQLAILKSTEETVDKFLRELPVTERIISVVCKYFESKFEDIMDKTRVDDVVYKRQMLFYFLRHYSGLSATHVGMIGKDKYDGGTVIHSCKVIINTQYLSNVKNDIEEIRKLILKTDNNVS